MLPPKDPSKKKYDLRVTRQTGLRVAARRAPICFLQSNCRFRFLQKKYGLRDSRQVCLEEATRRVPIYYPQNTWCCLDRRPDNLQMGKRGSRTDDAIPQPPSLAYSWRAGESSSDVPGTRVPLGYQSGDFDLRWRRSLPCGEGSAELSSPSSMLACSYAI